MKTPEGIPPALADVAQLNAKAVCAVLAWSRSHLYSQIRTGAFPAPIRYGQRCVRWPAQAVRDFVARQQ